ncbi:hypothetical protein NC651_036888 [Populus alba x Populus x berolinensis]|nr:hypothetical protein NC651_036888 [Populus alba x Populus x berolinensis]
MSLHTPSMISPLPSRPALLSIKSISRGDARLGKPGWIFTFAPVNMNRYHWGFLNQKHNSNVEQTEEARALLVKRFNTDGSAESRKVQKLEKEYCELIEED